LAKVVTLALREAMEGRRPGILGSQLRLSLDEVLAAGSR
jgi:hypothetical protein